MVNKSIKLAVKIEHIKEGIRNSYKKCPIAQAFNEMLADGYRCCVDVDRISIYRVAREDIGDFERDTKTFLRISRVFLTGRARRFVRNFDKGLPVPASNFVIIPDFCNEAYLEVS